MKESLFWMIWKELLAEFRTRETMTAMLIFSLTVILIFAFSFSRPGEKISSEILAGLIWVVITFSGLLGLNRTFLTEQKNDALLGLLLAPIDKSLIYLGKVASNLVFLGLVEIISLPLFFIFFGSRLETSYPLLILVLILGTLGFSGVGVFLAALASNTKISEILLPVLLFPLLTPLFLGAVKASGILLAGSWPDPVSAAGFWSWIRLMFVFDLVFFAAALLLFDYLMEV